MSPLRAILGFFLRMAVFYALLLSSWHGLSDVYRSAFRGMGTVMFTRFASGAGSAAFRPLSNDSHGRDTEIRVRNLKTGQTGSVEVESGFLGFRPTAFFLALVAASPVPWSRRGMAILIGGLVITGFVLLRVWLQLADSLSGTDVLDVYQFSAFWKHMLNRCTKVVVLSPEVGYFVPGLIWAAATFRRGDWERMWGPSVGNPDSGRIPGAAKVGRSNRGAGRHAG